MKKIIALILIVCSLFAITSCAEGYGTGACTYTESRDVTGRDAAVNVIHAGLECGIICSKLPDMDVISIGPSMHDIHSPDEALELSSTETFCQTLVRLMEIL